MTDLVMAHVAEVVDTLVAIVVMADGLKIVMEVFMVISVT